MHSLVLLLALYENVRLLLVAPAGLEMPAELLGELTGRLAVQSATLEQVRSAAKCQRFFFMANFLCAASPVGSGVHGRAVRDQNSKGTICKRGSAPPLLRESIDWC